MDVGICVSPAINTRRVGRACQNRDRLSDSSFAIASMHLGVLTTRHTGGKEDLPLIGTKALTDAAEVLNSANVEQASKDRYAKYLDDNSFSVRELTIQEALAAWEGYFSGVAPYKEVKNRSDIPDAHIIASVAELSKDAPATYFVAGDKALYEAAKALSGVNAFQSLDDLIASPAIVQLRNELSAEKKWQKVKALVSDLSIQEKAAEFVMSHGSELLEWLEISDDLIPGDNHAALIQAYGEPYAISTGKVEDWGAGYLRCTVSYHVEALLSFSIFRGDAFDVPNWISVTVGDFEKDHYFEAEGYRELKIEAPVSIKIDIDAISSSSDEDIYEISIEESEAEVSVSEDQD